jgi:hypothetical protein
VNAWRYSPPIDSFFNRPTGTPSVPVTAVGVRSRSDASFWFGTTFTHSFAVASIRSISPSGTSRRSFTVSAWLWQRIEPTRTQMPSIGIGCDDRPRILLPSACAFHSSRLWPLPRSASIHGSRLPASGNPSVSSTGSSRPRWRADHCAIDIEDR